MVGLLGAGAGWFHRLSLARFGVGLGLGLGWVGLLAWSGWLGFARLEMEGGNVTYRRRDPRGGMRDSIGVVGGCFARL